MLTAKLEPPLCLAASRKRCWAYQVCALALLVLFLVHDKVQELEMVMWMGGVTEFARVVALAATRGVSVVPHGSGPFGYFMCMAFPSVPMAEFLVMSEARSPRTATQRAPVWHPL